jgi:hypothetical protein
MWLTDTAAAGRTRQHGANITLEPVAKDWSWLDAIAGQV